MKPTTGEGMGVMASRQDLKTIEDFMGYPVGNLSEKITWNDIMPVVDRISKLHSIDGLYKAYSRIADALLMVNISILHNAVIEFINWYNQNKIT